jgi:PAS domain S-box-containing protein
MTIANAPRAQTTQRAVQEQGERHRLIAETAPVLVWMCDTDGLCTHVNEPWLTFTGSGLETQLGNGWTDNIHADDAQGRLEVYCRACQRQEPFTREFRLRRHDGEYRSMFDRGVPRFDEDGVLAGYIGACLDVTDLKQSGSEQVYANERLRLAVESGKSLAWEWDLALGRDVCFGDLQTILGRAGNSFTGPIEGFWRSVHPDDCDRIRAAVDHARESHTAYDEEFRVRWKDGTVRWVAARGRYYYSPNGDPTHMLGVAVDITERKQAEEALQQKERELREAQRLAGVGSWRWDADTEEVLWSAELFRIAGLEPSSPKIRADHPQLYTPESWERIAQVATEAMQSGTPYELDVEMVRPDGTKRWLTARGEPQRDNGRITGLQGTVQDITDRRQAQQALHESEERLRLAAEAGRMFAYTWDVATDTIVRSGESAHILGIDESTVLTGARIVRQMHDEDRPRVFAAMSALTPDHPNLHITYRMKRPDGSLIWLDRNSRAYFNADGTLVRLVGMVADVTERKLAEEALSSVSRRLIEAQEAERTRIARDLHDDVGQRLALVAVTLEKMRQQAEPAAPWRAHIAALQTDVATISSDVQALSHELHSSKLQLLGVVAAMRGFCSELSTQQQVEIDFSHASVPPAVPPDVSLCLFRVMQEALHNAVRHSGVRHFEVMLQGEAGALLLTVRDEGLGFNPEVAARGSGLGLTSMRERLKLVGGELSIDTHARRGTAIVATVPLAEPRTSTPL